MAIYGSGTQTKYEQMTLTFNSNVTDYNILYNLSEKQKTVWLLASTFGTYGMATWKIYNNLLSVERYNITMPSTGIMFGPGHYYYTGINSDGQDTWNAAGIKPDSTILGPNAFKFVLYYGDKLLITTSQSGTFSITLIVESISEVFQ